jgi:nitroreductase
MVNSMDTKDVIKIRRSIRKYQKKEVPNSLIEKLVEAARLAPSAYNAQPTKLVILKSREIKEKMKKNKIFRQDFVYGAPVIIAFLGDPEVYPKERLEPTYSNPSEIAGEIGAVRDISIAAQNLVLQATDLSLGTCYIGLVSRDKFKELLNIPKNYVLPFVITVGYPDENPKAMPRKSKKDLVVNEL